MSLVLQKKIALKNVNFQGIRNEVCSKVHVDKTCLKLSSKNVVLSKNARSVLYHSQLKGISYRGLSSFQEVCCMPVLSPTTAQDYIAKDGIDMLDLRRKERDEVLSSAGFDPKSGAPSDISEVNNKIENLPPLAKEKDIVPVVNRYNKEIESYRPRIEFQSKWLKTMPATPSGSVNIHLDEISSCKQVDTRTDFHLADPNPRVVYQRKQQQQLIDIINSIAGNDWQDHKKVHNAVAVVENEGYSYYIVDTSVKELLLSVLAYLTANNLIYTKRLVFFTDGARNLRTAIENVFGVFKPQIILDWYHVSRRVTETLSMAIGGTKEEKRKYRKDVNKYLWVGDTAGAIKVLEGFAAQKLVKNKKKFLELISYIEKRAPNIPCYALRKLLSLRNSSSPAEKANDILVAKRQKHNGMSWSTVGSIAQAQIAASQKNGLMESFIENRANVNWFKTDNQPTPPTGSDNFMVLAS